MGLYTDGNLAVGSCTRQDLAVGLNTGQDISVRQYTEGITGEDDASVRLTNTERITSEDDAGLRINTDLVVADVPKQGIEDSFSGPKKDLKKIITQE